MSLFGVARVYLRMKKDMNTLYFTQQFPDETACREHYRDMRIKKGLTCKKCSGTCHFCLASKWQFECKVCHFRTTLRSGTVMEHSNLSFRIWYLVILFMTATKKGISACEMQRQLGYKRYMTVWSLMHRIRTLMGERDDLYSLTGMIEFDEGFFEISTPANELKSLKRLILFFRTMSHPTVSYSLTKVKTIRIFINLSICISPKNHQNSQRRQRLNGLTLLSATQKELFLVSIIK